MEGVFLDFCCFKSFFIQHHIHEKKNSIPSPPICIAFVFNWIWNQIPFNVFELNSMQFESNSMTLGLNFNSIEKKCHSLFSFKWNLIFTKSILVFHQLIVIGSAYQRGTQVGYWKILTLMKTPSFWVTFGWIVLKTPPRRKFVSTTILPYICSWKFVHFQT